MNNNTSFFSLNKILGTLIAFFTVLSSIAQTSQKTKHQGPEERQFLVDQLVKIADPVLVSLSQNQLKKDMPVEQLVDGRQKFTYLEAFGRLLAGIAPWLELGEDNSKEGQLRGKYIKLTHKSLHNATDPESPDFMNFNKGPQPLVDAAFLAQGLLRAPTQLWDPLDQETKDNIITALESSRVIKPYNNNWLLFSAMVEAAILKFTGTCKEEPLQKAISAHMKWYKGDGTYGDGPNFHWDYYNSFVIQPMLLDIVNTLKENDENGDYDNLYEVVLKRAKRYAYIQASLISPEGTYPPLGRSLAYRFGAFQVLSQVALMEELPASIQPQEVRAALYTVIKRQLSAEGTFDKNGWLQLGMVGHQPKIAETYISTGSLYLNSVAFLMLGLPDTNEFWQGKDVPWISKRIWNGENEGVMGAQD